MLAALGAHPYPWAYPMLKAAHLFGVGLVIDNLMLLELRVFGCGQALPVVQALARLSLSLVLCGFSVAALTGLLMFGTQPQKLLANRVFTAKMALLMLAGCNAAWFHSRQPLLLLGFTFKDEKGGPVLRAEYLFLNGVTYRLRSSPA